ncbi:radical SAM protein [Lutibacter sp.]
MSNIQNNRFNQPPTVCIQLHDWCNLKCKNCRSNSSPHANVKLKIKSICNLLNDLSNYGKWRISLTGGEPLYFEGLFDVLQVISDKKFNFSLTTNGVVPLKNLHRIKDFFNQNGKLHISIDGNEKLHDINRGNGTFRKTIKFAKEARKLVPYLSVTTVLYENPSTWIDELINTLIELNIDNWTLISPVNEGRQSKLFDNNYSSYAKKIDDILIYKKVAFTYYFLDFNTIERQYKAVTFINSDGLITMPQLYTSKRKEKKKKHIDDINASLDIFNSALDFQKLTKNKTIV